MIKAKHILVAILLATVIYSCGDDDSSSEPFDHAAQAIIDNDSLVGFLRNHYYDTTVDSVKPLVAGETALYNDPNLKTQNVTEQEVDYKLYYYVKRIGNPMPVKGFPTVVDSILAKYSGQRIVNTDSLTVPFDGNTLWFTLSGVIRGWTYGFTHFKGGQNVSGQNPNDPINYIDGGKGVLFIPSGLAYRERGTGSNIPANSNLMFYIELWDLVENTDGDGDSIPSILEDIDGDGDPRNDDTDGDNRPNYFDTDDDGDGKPTKDEDRNGDGDPTNDFNDPNNPNLPDYLNPDIFG